MTFCLRNIGSNADPAPRFPTFPSRKKRIVSFDLSPAHYWQQRRPADPPIRRPVFPPPADPPTRRSADPFPPPAARFPYCASLRVPGLEKEIFGSVTSAFDVPFPAPPLWHEASDAISTARMNRAAQLDCFRIRNESRTKAGCKLPKEWATKSESGALAYFQRTFPRMDNNVNQPWNKLQERIGREPKKAVALAFAAGFFLCLLPLGRLLGILVRVLFLLFKPALLILGVIKLLEYIRLSCGAHE